MLVLGNEGNGLRRLTREKCDQLVGLPAQGPVPSLNVAAAAAASLAVLGRPQ
jgi:23S rRNA (guanosine2251-2'-O)-methyltransferase